MQSRSDEDIYPSMKSLLDEYDAWKDVKIINLDTTAVNTGHKIGVVVRFKKSLEKPQYIGCQYILDVILKACYGSVFSN